MLKPSCVLVVSEIIFGAIAVSHKAHIAKTIIIESALKRMISIKIDAVGFFGPEITTC
jgi:hypothetical protein